mmetsp:Transcript_17194/g.58084  ORF Transcript_17194/g.58084 Transcript_17194/m.58084 type:complete len:242 (+) Transcript_17194:510-1235(+)
MTSLPWRWKPRSWSNDAIWSTETSVNGVASPSLPVSAPTLDCRHSTRCPTVMREGMACGLTMISGVMPSRVQGMSSCRYVMPIVPFWPWREANLSPICGVRTARVRTFANFMPSWFVESNTSSMMPLSLGRIAVEASRLVNREGSPSAVTAAAGVVLPMMMSVPETRTPGETMPSASTFSYEPCLIAVQSPRSGRSNTSCWPAFSPTPLECSWSVYVRKKCDRKRPRSMALWFMIRLSSWL